jgi:hypothetical protein
LPPGTARLKNKKLEPAGADELGPAGFLTSINHPAAYPWFHEFSGVLARNRRKIAGYAMNFAAMQRRQMHLQQKRMRFGEKSACFGIN